MTAPGIEVRPLVTMTGRATFNETFFTDVRVPVDQIVMGRGDGWHVANVTLKYERLLLGDANRLSSRLERIRELMERTTLDGQRIMDIPEYRDRLLRLQGEVMASKYHGLRLLTEQARGEDSGLRRLIVKYNGTMLGYRLSSLAVDVLGAAGLAYDAKDEAAETDEATAWHIDNMYDIGLMIGGGSTNIQKNIIGERGLGLPREPKAATAGEELSHGIRPLRRAEDAGGLAAGPARRSPADGAPPRHRRRRQWPRRGAVERASSPRASPGSPCRSGMAARASASSMRPSPPRASAITPRPARSPPAW